MLKTLSLLFVILATISFPAAAQSSSEGNWVDYAFGEFNIYPNITYSTANNTQLKLDLYLPEDHSKPLPTLVLFHGGGWVGGQKERNVFQLLPYLSMGWAVINVEYRLASNSPAPAAVEDCRCALRWVFYNSQKYNFDLTKVVLTGGSAGGHLSLITGMLPAGSEFDFQCETNDSTRWVNGSEPIVKPAAIVNWYGITDVAELLEGPGAKHYAIEWFGSINNRKELAEKVSPVSYVSAGIPPIITIHGSEDNIVPYSQAVKLHSALDKAGLPNELVTIRDGKHGGFNKQALLDSFSKIRAFLKKHKIISDDEI